MMGISDFFKDSKKKGVKLTKKQFRQNTVKQRLKIIMEKYPETRDSDELLTRRYWLDYQPEFFTRNEGGDWLNIGKLPQLEKAPTIKRCRANIQNDDNLFLPINPKVREHRGRSEQNWRDWLQEEKRMKL